MISKRRIIPTTSADIFPSKHAAIHHNKSSLFFPSLELDNLFFPFCRFLLVTGERTAILTINTKCNKSNGSIRQLTSTASQSNIYLTRTSYTTGWCLICRKIGVPWGFDINKPFFKHKLVMWSQHGKGIIQSPKSLFLLLLLSWSFKPKRSFFWLNLLRKLILMLLPIIGLFKHICPTLSFSDAPRFEWWKIHSMNFKFIRVWCEREREQRQQQHNVGWEKLWYSRKLNKFHHVINFKLRRKGMRRAELGSENFADF